MWVLKVFAIVVLVDRAELISTKHSRMENKNTSLEMLWDLTNLALQQTNLEGRQGGYGFPQNNRPYQPGYRPQGPYNHGYPQNQQYPSPGPFGFQGPQGPASIMDVLHSVAQNDELHCVPKLLCELTSNTRSDGKQSSLLPFNLNMDSLLGLFSAFGPSSNPLFLFGRAALLGYTTRGSSCYSAFSRCPNDPDQLVNYLNNYNGGFFRYFNGNPRPHPSLQQQYYQGYPQRYYPQKRILTNSITNKYPYRFPYEHDSGNRLSNGIKFPADDVVSNSIDSGFYTKQAYKSTKTLTFPDGTSGDGRYYKNFRGAKTLSFPDAHYDRGLDFQMVRPSHVASPYIFPTRTGTGELLLDTEELY